MKGLFLVVGLLAITSQSYADDCCCEHKPKIVYKTVVKKVPVVVEKTVVTEKVVLVDKPVIKEKIVVLKQKAKKNRISLLGGTGPSRLEKEGNEARLIREPIAGLQYQRMLGNSLSIGVQVQTNESVLGSVGFDF